MLYKVVLTVTCFDERYGVTTQMEQYFQIVLAGGGRGGGGLEGLREIFGADKIR